MHGMYLLSAQREQYYLHRYILEKGQLALVPGDAFGAPNCLRISYAASLDRLRAALDRLEGALTSSALSRPRRDTAAASQ